MKKVVSFLLLVLVVASVVMSTVALVTEEAYATPLCPPTKWVPCPWNPDSEWYLTDNDCCCPGRYYTGPAICI